MSAIIARLLPAYVACADFERDDPSARLLPGEEPALRGAVQSRIGEFATARSCARRALQQFGAPAVALPSGPNREPLWPQGYVGSITHCEGYRAAAVARRQDALSIGIDAEPHEPLPSEILSLVTVSAERAWLARAPEGVYWDRLIFSAKESVYKAWFPLNRAWLDFGDVCITVNAATGDFSATLLPGSCKSSGHSLDNFTGRFLFTPKHILTAIVVGG
jgi:4'-phosphopantetheinyl transferase EntD